MSVNWITPEEVAFLRERKVDQNAMNRHIAWRGHDDRYCSQLREIYGLPPDLREIAIAPFPNRVLIVTLNGASSGLFLMFIPCQPDGNMRVESLFLSVGGVCPDSLMLDVDVQPVIDATHDLLGRHLGLPHRGVQ